MKRIGMLTSGGDCQALNAAMRGVVKGLSNNLDELEIYGFHNGYKGLIYGDYHLYFFFELIQALSYVFFNYITNHLSVCSREISFHKLYSHSHHIFRNYEF